MKPALNFRYWTRKKLLDEFYGAWDLTSHLFSGLKNEAAFLTPPAHGLRHPLIFYFNHPAVFYMNKLQMAGVVERHLDEKFESYFAIGVDENSWDDMSKNESGWPALSDVDSYREKVKRIVSDLIENHPAFETCPESPMDSPAHWAILMGIEHEYIHIETSSVLIRELPIEHVRRPKSFPRPHESASKFTGEQPRINDAYTKPEFVKINGGEVKLGKPNSWPMFGWDNEYGHRRVSVPQFSASRFLTSNGEFFEFAESGGYKDKSLWTDEGWQWCEYRARKNENAIPYFWRVRAGRFFLRTIFEEIPLPWSWPAIVNFHEAKAFAQWRSRKDGKEYRLMTEGEHHHLRSTVDAHVKNELCNFESWYASALASEANLGLRYGSESPVNLTKQPLCDVIGNVWQWCEDVFTPLEGFQPHSLYSDYSVPSFDGRHQVLLGGSFISLGEQTSPWVRNNFRRHFFQHAGVRLVGSV